MAEGIAEKAVADGEIAIFKSANGMYLQADAIRKNISYLLLGFVTCSWETIPTDTLFLTS